MNGDERRQTLINLIKTSSQPLSGSQLAEKLQVSRQVIVNDVALIRASNIDIISTNRGYIIKSPVYCTRTFKVNHKEADFEEEMNTIIDAGGKIQDVIIDHPVYGKISAPLEIYSRNDVMKFREKMQSDHAVPLCKITSGIHFHTVLGYSEQVLDDVEQALDAHGYLCHD